MMAGFRRIRQFGGVALAVLLLVLVIASAGLQDLWATLQTVDAGYLLAACGLNLFMAALMAYRWYILYAVDSARPTYRRLLALTFIGIFVNSLLPSVVGGDAYRAVRTKREDGFSGALSVVYVDRLTGLMGLGLVGLGALVLGGAQIEFSPAMQFWVGGLFALLCAALILSLNKHFHKAILRVVEKVPRGGWLAEQLAPLFARLLVYAGRRDLLTGALVVSVGLRLVWLAGCYLVGLALGLDVSPVVYLVLVPVIELIRMIPITIQGIGVREGLFVLLFGHLGVPAAEATLLAVLIYLLLMVNGVAGGFVFLGFMISRQPENTADGF